MLNKRYPKVPYARYLIFLLRSFTHNAAREMIIIVKAVRLY